MGARMPQLVEPFFRGTVFAGPRLVRFADSRGLLLGHIRATARTANCGRIENVGAACGTDFHSLPFLQEPGLKLVDLSIDALQKAL